MHYRIIRNEKVRGSTPLGSTILAINHLHFRRQKLPQKVTSTVVATRMKELAKARGFPSRRRRRGISFRSQADLSPAGVRPSSPPMIISGQRSAQHGAGSYLSTECLHPLRL